MTVVENKYHGKSSEESDEGKKVTADSVICRPPSYIKDLERSAVYER